MHRPIRVIAVVLSLAPAAFAGGVYKWVDEQGKGRYGDRPPAAASPESIDVRPAPVQDADWSARQQKQTRLLNAIGRERGEKRRAEESARAEREAKKRRCELARRELARYERANLLFVPDENGDPLYFDEEQRNRALEIARERERELCR